MRIEPWKRNGPEWPKMQPRNAALSEFPIGLSMTDFSLAVVDSASKCIKKGHLEMPHMDSAVGSPCYRGAFCCVAFWLRAGWGCEIVSPASGKDRQTVRPRVVRSHAGSTCTRSRQVASYHADITLVTSLLTIC